MKITRALLATATLGLSAAAFGHAGHGLSGIAHDLVHLVWLINGAALLGVALLLYRAHKQSR